MQLCYSKFLIIALLCVNAFLVISGTNITQLDIELGEKTTCFSFKEATTTSLEGDVYLIEKSNTTQAQKVSEPSLEKTFVLQDIQLPANQNSHLSITQYTQMVSWIYYASNLPDPSFSKIYAPLSTTQHEVNHIEITTTERTNSLTHEPKEIKSNTILSEAYAHKSATTILDQDNTNDTQEENNYLIDTENTANTNDTQDDNNYYIAIEKIRNTLNKNNGLTATENTNNTQDDNNYLYIAIEKKVNTNDTQKENNYLIDTEITINTNGTQDDNSYLYIDTEITNTNNTQNNNSYLYTDTEITNTNNTQNDNNYLYTDTEITNTNNTQDDNNYLYIAIEKKVNTNDNQNNNNYLYIGTENANTNNTQNDNNYLYTEKNVTDTNNIQENSSYYVSIKKIEFALNKNNGLYIAIKNANTNDNQADSMDTENTTNSQNKNNGLHIEMDKKNTPDNQEENDYLYIDRENTTNSQNGNDYLYVVEKMNKNNSKNENYLSMQEENADSSLKALALKRETIIIKATSKQNNLNTSIPLYMNNEIEINNAKNQEISNNINKTVSHKGQKKIDEKHMIITQKQQVVSEQKQYYCNTTAEIRKNALTTNSGTGQSTAKNNLLKTVNGHIVNSTPTTSHIEINKDIQRSVSQNNFERNIMAFERNEGNTIDTIAKENVTQEVIGIDNMHISQVASQENTATKITFTKESKMTNLLESQKNTVSETTSTISEPSLIAGTNKENLHLRHIRKGTLESNTTPNYNIAVSLSKLLYTFGLHLLHIRKTEYSSSEKNMADFEKHNNFSCQKNDLSNPNLLVKEQNESKKNVHLRHIRKSDLLLLNQVSSIHRTTSSRKTIQFDAHRTMKTSQICKKYQTSIFI